MPNPMDLTGKHVLITGGSSGIGRECAVQASRLGARVTLIARREEALRETVSLMDCPGEQGAYAFDLSQTGRIEELVGRIVRERGPVDGLCHAAGIGTARDLKMTKPAFVEKMFRVHTFAFLELVRCLSLKGCCHEGASFVGISSVAAEKGNVSQCAYASAKAAMNGFVVPASQELAKRKIRINNVAYAMVDTDMYREFLDAGGDPKVMSRQLLGVISVESAADAVMFLLSGASQFITGAVLPVYAGY